ncbi:hypothetical protein [Streptomyces griseofuscus]|uniref:hypothetical protein n=1 Tax=Streptomyces griseofuscus TaxID=146922 RepID=UPI0033C9C0A9
MSRRDHFREPLGVLLESEVCCAGVPTAWCWRVSAPRETAACSPRIWIAAWIGAASATNSSQSWAPRVHRLCPARRPAHPLFAGVLCSCGGSRTLPACAVMRTSPPTSAAFASPASSSTSAPPHASLALLTSWLGSWLARP